MSSVSPAYIDRLANFAPELLNLKACLLHMMPSIVSLKHVCQTAYSHVFTVVTIASFLQSIWRSGGADQVLLPSESGQHGPEGSACRYYVWAILHGDTWQWAGDCWQSNGCKTIRRRIHNVCSYLWASSWSSNADGYKPWAKCFRFPGERDTSRWYCLLGFLLSSKDFFSLQALCSYSQGLSDIMNILVTADRHPSLVSAGKNSYSAMYCSSPSFFCNFASGYTQLTPTAKVFNTKHPTQE